MMSLRALLLLATTLAFAPLPLRADDACCSPVIQVHGNILFRDVSDAPDQIAGKRFTASVANLEPGTYRVEVDLVETEYHEPDQRRMEVEIARKKVAEQLDLVAAAGFGQVFTVSGEVEHLGDAQRGPLEVRFTGRKGEAVFSAIRVFDLESRLITMLKAEDLRDLDDRTDVVPVVDGPKIYLDPSQPQDARIKDLIRRMTMREKAAQLVNGAPAIERLEVPEYDYWNECLHGVARAGTATVFPQAIALAATWNLDKMKVTADTIATEARAKHHEFARQGERGRYQGLTFWTPNINIFRDPRWGRGQETYGEDPLLTGLLGVAFIEGLQGNDPNYMKVMACAKHFAVHSGPEPERHTFDATAPEADIYDTYFPQFEMAVKEAKVGSVMSAYNRLDGESATSSPFLLTEVLRERWGFTGHVMSDCGAVFDIWARHKLEKTPEAAVARAIKAGCDLNCGSQYYAIPRAVKQGLLTEAEVDRALYRVLLARFQLGMFDPPEMVPYAQIPITELDTPEHAQLALEMAHESMVLMSNDGTLPLAADKLRTIAVIGANADSVPMLLGNYNGTPSAPVTILQGIRDAVGEKVTVTYALGAPLVAPADADAAEATRQQDEAVALAKAADVVIYVGGLSPQLEGEEMRVNLPGFRGGDRTRIELPDSQSQLLRALHATGKPVVMVNCSGSAVAMPWEADNLAAILQAWYPGQAGGTAVAGILFGKVNPSGRLPITFYRSTDDLPDFEKYAMQDRTYRFFSGKPLFAFGHGLSYTQFGYTNARAAKGKVKADGTIEVRVKVKNQGKMAGDEVVQLYCVQRPTAQGAQRQLLGFTRVTLQPGESQVVTLSVPAERLRLWDTEQDSYTVIPGSYTLGLGAASDDIREEVKVNIR